MTEVIHSRTDGGILEVTLDRPKANAIDLATSRQMGDVFQSFRERIETHRPFGATLPDQWHWLLADLM